MTDSANSADPADSADLAGYHRIAADAVAEARGIFLNHVGAAPSLMKGKGDFATEADLAIEALLRERLGAATGIPVYGEEGGGDFNAEACWVVDPIDGTSNYSSGNPNCAILVSLIRGGQPVVAFTEMPMLRLSVSAVAGQPVMCNGETLPPLGADGAGTYAAAQVGVGSVGSDDRVRFPAATRLQLIGELAKTQLRPRISGSVGVDLAFVALGIYQAAVSFSPHIWDNAAGVLISRSAGAVVTDVDGHPWGAGSAGAIVGTTAAHQTALRTMLHVASQ